jgi:hypothetical protein
MRFSRVEGAATIADLPSPRNTIVDRRAGSLAVVVVDRVLRREDLAQPVIPPLAGDEEDLLPIWRLEGIELRPVRQGR